jgi:hypothetical protein
MSSNPYVPKNIDFVISDFEASIRLQQDAQTWASEPDSISASFAISGEIPVSVMKKMFMFSTDEINYVSQGQNVEDVNFLIDSTAWSGHDPLSISTYPASSEQLSIATYTTATNNTTLSTYLSWLMYQVTHIPDSLVLVKNDADVALNMNRLFKYYVWNNTILSQLWAQDFRRSPRYDSANVAITNPTINTFAVSAETATYLDSTNSEASITSNSNLHALTGSTVYSVMPYSQTRDPSTFPIAQKLFEILVSQDLARFSGYPAGLSPLAPLNNGSAIQDDLGNTYTNIYQFPFIVGDTIQFKVNFKVPIDNVKNMFGGVESNLTDSMKTLNAELNAGINENVDYVSYHITYTIVEDPLPSGLI